MRKTAVLAALCTLSLGAPGLALAATNPNILAANNEIGLSVSGNLLNYQEHANPSDTESGWTTGFGVKYSLMQNLAGIHNAYVAVRFGWSRGNVAYHGFTQRLTANGVVFSPYQGTDNATMYRVIARVGMGLNVRPGAMVTPFVFGGYQHWNRHLLGPKGYTEDYHAGVVGLGAMVQDAVTRKLVVTLTPEFGAVVGGGLHTNLFDGHVTPASFGTTGEEKISLSADYALSGAYGYGAGMGWHLYGGLSYTHYNYTGGPISLAYHGQTVPFGDEPFSSTNLFQVQAGVAYSF